ncbi:MAG TPA: hypothetical protein DCE14_00075 [Kosmotogaceae bacterium]|nr:hypothetical protein [Kosmotogaceae bacterium]
MSRTSETKERHNIMLTPSSWKLINELGRIQRKSASEILEEALWKMIESEGYNSTYFKLMATAEQCDPQENEELTRVLDEMTEEDMRITRKYDLHR